MLKKYGLIGHNISYSKSPVIYNYWFNKYSINAQYNIIDVPLENLSLNLINNLVIKENYKGFNITKPHKEFFLKNYSLSKEATEIQAINTLVVNDVNNSYTIKAYNTDYIGLLNSFTYLNIKPKNVLILGSGGAAKSLIYALLILNKNVNIYLHNRDINKITDIQNIFINANINNFNSTINTEFDIVFNATSVDFFVTSYMHHVNKNTIFYDLNYKKFDSNNLAHELGWQKIMYVNGLNMLQNQAVANFELWFNIKANITKDLTDLII